MIVQIVAKTLLIDPDCRALVLRRSKTDTHHPGAYDFPGGSVDDGEDIIAGAVREIAEETGQQIDPKSLQLGYAFSSLAKDEDKLIHSCLFVAHTDSSDVSLSDEHQEYWWMNSSELEAAFEGSSWSKGITIILKYKLD